MSDLVLPAFALDCRDWFVLSPAEAGLPDDVEGAPVLAVFSGVIVDDAEQDLLEITGVLSVGLLDGDSRDELEGSRVAPGSIASRLIDDTDDTAERAVADPSEATLRYVMPVADQPLALLAEFTVAVGDARVLDLLEPRVTALMASFTWQD